MKKSSLVSLLALSALSLNLSAAPMHIADSAATDSTLTPDQIHAEKKAEKMAAHEKKKAEHEAKKAQKKAARQNNTGAMDSQPNDSTAQ